MTKVKYTMTQKEAAEEIGITPAALRQEFLNPPRHDGKYAPEHVEFIKNAREKTGMIDKIIAEKKDAIYELREDKKEIRESLANPDTYPSLSER